MKIYLTKKVLGTIPPIPSDTVIDADRTPTGAVWATHNGQDIEVPPDSFKVVAEASAADNAMRAAMESLD